MELILKNINSFKKYPKNWLLTISMCIRTKFMSKQEKTDLLIQAETQSKAILIEKGLMIPFRIFLENFNIKEDSSFLTVAKYRDNSQYNGSIRISIKSHLLGANVDVIIHTILHEYSHAIFEKGLSNFNLFSEIISIKKYYTLFSYSGSQDYFGIEEEQFCEFFPFYLTNKLNINFHKEQIEEIDVACEKIIKKYMFRRIYESSFQSNTLF